LDAVPKPPDAVVLHVGINDIKGKDPTACGRRVAGLARRVVSRFPKSHVFVSQAVPVRNVTMDSRREILNATVRAETMDLPSISLINHHFPTDSRFLSADGIHPTRRGAAAVSRKLGHHLEDYFWQKPRSRQLQSPRPSGPHTGATPLPRRPTGYTGGRQLVPEQGRFPRGRRGRGFPTYINGSSFPFPWDY
jgi:hypothetical protein